MKKFLMLLFATLGFFILGECIAGQEPIQNEDLSVDAVAAAPQMQLILFSIAGLKITTPDCQGLFNRKINFLPIPSRDRSIYIDGQGQRIKQRLLIQRLHPQSVPIIIG